MDKLLFIKIVYIVSAVLFMYGLKRMAHPRTAVRGNLYGVLGMILAVAATMWSDDVDQMSWIAGGIFGGAAIGILLAYLIQMTAMPQLVALFNGFGGLASVIVAGAMLLLPGNQPSTSEWVATALTGIVGSVTFLGSTVAFGKLQELDLFKKSRRLPFPHLVNSLLFLTLIGVSIMMIYDQNDYLYVVIVLVASLLGFLLVNSIGGADMPVVIALFNSYSGLAATATGFVINNDVLIISGSLVGASGLILTKLMCKAMNRSLANVMFGSFGATAVQQSDKDGGEQKPVRSVTAEDSAMVLAYSKSVIFVPGYGLAVSQAQHHVRELADLLEEKGVVVKYAIHPVAGRMPGHMNVLLAEANVSYDKLYDLDAINDEFGTTDVAVIVGANDVVNPAARDAANSPIYGMPILNADKATNIIFIKRSLSPGFAGIDNELFYKENTMMLFSDAKDALVSLISAVKES